MNLSEVAVRTFRDRAIRSAVLIDDQFPKFDDAYEYAAGLRADDEPDFLDRYTEASRAARLHRGFHRLHIPCDIENDPGLTDESEDAVGVPDRLRKCDLVVLDYNLEGDGDATLSLQLLARLADSEHFNMVVLYTRNPNLDEVWMRVASNIKRGRRAPEEIVKEAVLEKYPKATEDDLLNAEVEWEEAARKLPSAPAELVRACLGDLSHDPRELKRGLSKSVRSSLAKDRLYLTPAYTSALIQREIEKLLVGGPSEAEQREIVGKCGPDVRWVMSRHLFVAIVSKRSGDSDEDEVEYIYEGIEDAIHDWAPNFFQIVASEAQNVLEVEALTLGDRSLIDDELHLGIALSVAAEGVTPEDGADMILTRLGQTLSERVRERVDAQIDEWLELDADAPRLRSGVAALLQLAQGAIGDESDLFGRAEKLAHTSRKWTEATKAQVLKRLNAYLCSHPLNSRHLTSGSVFTDEKGGYWLCMTPACDMVPRGPRKAPDQPDSPLPVHPGKQFRAVRLVLESKPNTVVQGAKPVVTHGRHIFIEEKTGADILVLRVVDPETREPFIEPFVAASEGVLDDSQRFEAGEIVHWPYELAEHEMDARPFRIKTTRFRVIGRLRDAYTDRFLGMIGHHVSRVGVDFVGDR